MRNSSMVVFSFGRRVLIRKFDKTLNCTWCSLILLRTSSMAERTKLRNIMSWSEMGFEPIDFVPSVLHFFSINKFLVGWIIFYLKSCVFIHDHNFHQCFEAKQRHRSSFLENCLKSMKVWSVCLVSENISQTCCWFSYLQSANMWMDDEHFGQQRLSGCNPTIIKKCTALPGK